MQGMRNCRLNAVVGCFWSELPVNERSGHPYLGFFSVYPKPSGRRGCPPMDTQTGWDNEPRAKTSRVESNKAKSKGMRMQDPSGIKSLKYLYHQPASEHI